MDIEQLYVLYRQHPVVCTDTRKITAGCLFFALRGEHFDGNKFAETALAAGAAYAVIDDALVKKDERYILVPNVLSALQELARHHRRQFQIPVIGIGGSNGKTTTKELIAAVLNKHYPCHFTKGNLNNHIGVPLTLLEMPLKTEVAVIEMGTNQPGDVAQLCAIAEPTHGLITNIGKEHLEGFGSIEGVKKAEGELYEYIIRKNGILFVNADEKYLSAMSRKNARRIFYSGAGKKADINVTMTREMPCVEAAYTSDEGEMVALKTNLYGRHNFNNIMTAIAMGVYFKVPSETIKTALEAYTPVNNRSQRLLYKGATILLDAYNANPSSMRPALESLKAMPAQTRWAILGDMLELGADSQKEHQNIVKLTQKLRLDRVVLVGAEFGKVMVDDARYLHFQDNIQAKHWFDQQSIYEVLILIKGSRGIKLEYLLQP